MRLGCPSVRVVRNSQRLRRREHDAGTLEGGEEVGLRDDAHELLRGVENHHLVHVAAAEHALPDRGCVPV